MTPRNDPEAFERLVGTSLCGDGLSAAELAALERRVMRAIAVPERSAIAAWRWPAWAAVGAVAALALWVSLPGRVAEPESRAAVRAPRAATPAALRRVEEEAVAVLATEMTGLAPMSVAGFDSVKELAGITVAGTPAPMLAAARRGGRRALVLTQLGVSPTQVDIPMLAGTGGIGAVSAWIWAEDGEAEVSLELVGIRGDAREVEPRRRVAPGQWMLVTYRVPADAVAGPVAGLRFSVAGARTVAVDRVEVWRHER